MFLINFAIICAHLLFILKCQIIYSDQVPIVYFQQNIWLFKYGDSSYQGSQQIYYSAQSFQQVPTVILGISFYNNFWNPSSGVDFILSATQITQTSCIVQTARNNNSYLVGISVSALVIDTSQFPFFTSTDRSVQNIQFLNYVYQQDYSFSSSIINQSNKSVSVILTGWKSTYDSSNTVFALTIQVINITNSGYTIKISTAQFSQKIVNVFYTVLEYIQNPQNSIYGIVSNYDTQYQQPTTQNCFFNNSCQNSQRFFPVQFSVFIQNQSSINNYLNYFVSINQIYFNTQQNNQDLRISIINQPLSSNNIQYQYSIWDGSQCLGTTSTALYFYKKTCPNNQFININSNSCFTACQIQDTSNSQICLDCPSGQYFLQDKNVCQTAQPIGYSCSIPSAQFNFNVCQNCKISNCKLCTQNSNSFVCTQCISQYFLFNNLCQQAQPSNTYCDTQSYVCTKCLDPSCLTCSNPSQPSNSQCITCDTIQNQILYQGKCYSQSSPPDNTFCDWSKKNCLKCNDDNCLVCSDPASPPQICNKCLQNQALILFQGKCFDQNNPPPNTYCDWNKLQCSLCIDSNCLTCSDPSQSPQLCLSCDASQKKILYQGKCYNQNNPPPNTFCDWDLLRCSKCKDPNCLFCSDPSQPPQICYSCDIILQQLILYQGKCFSQNSPPSNTFCDWSKLTCSQCTDNRCLTCSDPNNLTQICLSCDVIQKLILFQGKCFNQNNPPPNTYCDWTKLQCAQCTDPSCLTCNDPKQSPQKCLSCDVNKKQVLFQDKCYSQNFPPPNTFCDWDKLQCVQCTNSNCYRCSNPNQSPQVCLSCNSRMILFEGKCYCGIGLYLDENNNCNKNCVQSCQFCQNSSNCDKYSDNRVYSGNQCDYSCSQCSIPNKSYGCLTCSSTTRQLEVMTGSCFCKSGYNDIGIPECQDNNSLKPQQQIQNANNNILQGLLIIYFPQLLINIHPFTDNFIFQIQLLGNLYFVNQNNTQILYKSFATLNFVNIFYESSQADVNDVQFMIGIKPLVVDMALHINLENIDSILNSSRTSNQVPFAFQQQGVQLFEYSNTQLQGQQSIDYSSKSFQQTPIVIVGIDFFNNIWNANPVDFILSSEQVTQSSCVVKATRNNQSTLAGISASVLVLDTSQFPLFNKIDKKITGIQFNNYVFSQYYQFSTNLQNQVQKNVSVILTGWAYQFTSAKSVLAITIQVTNITESGYTITINTAQQSQVIISVYFTILEYIQNPPNSKYGIISNYDTQYQQPTTQNCFYDTSCNNSKRYFPVQFDVLIQNQSTTAYSNFFVSINQFYFTTQLDQNNNQDQRIRIVNNPLSLNKIQYQYQIWDGAKCQGTKSTALYFYMKTCPSGQILNTNNNICSTACQIEYNSQICLDCSQGQYFLQDKNICQVNQPIGYYCSIPSSQYNFNVCQICNISNCKYCTQNSDQTFQCTQCINSYFLYNNQCFQVQPPNTFCDTQTLICSKCTDTNCLTCCDPSQQSSLCLTCDSSQNQALYEGKCYTKNSPPNNTFCDWSKLTCIKCSDSSCLSCSDPSKSPQICVTCDSIQQKILYQDKCFSQNSPPSNTFCDWSKLECSQCGDSSCLTCSDPKQTPQNCLKCIDNLNQILFQGKCYTEILPPSNTFCDWKNMQCTQCSDPSCLKCSDPSISPQICESCNYNQAIYEGKCYAQNSPPQNTFCDWKNQICSKCQDSSCLSCSDPAQTPQKCVLCNSSQKQILYNGKCFSQSSPPSNTFCDWSILQCFQCNDISCLACSNPQQQPQICLSCIDNLNQILYQGKCYTQNSPPSKAFCDWKSMQCTECQDPSCLTCSDPNKPPQLCLSCDPKKGKILFQGKCFCGIGLNLDENDNCSQKCSQDCLLCLNNHSCDKYSDNRNYSDNECNYSCSQCFIPQKNYGCTKCSSPTRQLETITGSCFCKDGYSDIGIPECQDDNALKPYQQIETTSDNVLQALFIFYLPQLFINIYPFTDYFIFQIQTCLDCPSGQYFLSDQNICQKILPTGYYCSIPNQQYNFNVYQNYTDCLTCSDPTLPPQKCLSCIKSQTQILFQNKCQNQVLPPPKAFCDWKNMQCTQCSDPSFLTCSNPNKSPQQCLSCDQSIESQATYEGKCYIKNSPPQNTFCDWKNQICSKCQDNSCYLCSDPAQSPQICVLCVFSQKQILYYGKYFSQSSPPSNTYCDWGNLQCSQCKNSSYLACSNPNQPIEECYHVFIIQIRFYIKVPFVFQQQGIKLYEYGNSALQGTQTINYSSKTFLQTPIVIVGIDFFNNYWNPPDGVDFIISSESVTINNCTVKVTRNSGNLFGISVSLLALNTSQFLYFNKIEYGIYAIQFNNYKYQKPYQFSPNLQNKGQKSVSVVLTGWAQQKFTSAKSVLAITIQVTDLTDTGYTITITSAQQSQVITNVYFTILEYIQNPPQSIYGIISNYDTLYQQPTTQKCFYDTSCSNSQRYFTVYFNVLIQNQSPSTSDYSNFFVSINQFYFTTQMSGQDLRINIVNKPLSSSQIQYQYQIWDGAQCQGTTSTALYFYKKICSPGQFVNTNSNICSSVCQIQFNSQICLDCSSGQYFLQDQNICQTTQPTGYYCSIPSQQYNFNVCQNCNITNCKYCTQNSDKTFQCTQCMSQYFFFNNSCTLAQPPNAFCDTQTLVCSKCLDMSCLTCSDPSQPLSQCLSCDASQNQALYEGKCYIQNSPPNNTFCDWSKLACSKCSDSSCLSCSDTSKQPQICVTCDSTQQMILYQDKCFSQNNPPANTFCDWSKLECFQCSDSSCFTCSDPIQTPQQCLECIDSLNQILYQGKCYTQNSPPSNTFCDWKNMQCTQCSDPSCLTCSDPRKSPQICESCNQNQAIYEGKCYAQNSPPQNTFCDWKNQICSKCQDSSCLYCSDPAQTPQKCVLCNSSQQQILYNGKCFSQSSPPSNTFCDWSILQCLQCNDISCLACSDPQQSPQICLSCIDNLNQILYQGKCYTQSSPPSKAFCDWKSMQCTECQDPSCLTCSDPNKPPQLCLPCDPKKGKITEISDTYQINNDQNYQKCQNLILSSSILAVISPDNIQQIIDSFLWTITFCLLFTLGNQTDKLFENTELKEDILPKEQKKIDKVGKQYLELIEINQKENQQDNKY
ncbi:hypothetical protein ABPG72_014756, partial [Tetrahymena utriculariae]